MSKKTDEQNAKQQIRKNIRQKRQSLSPQASLFAGHGVYENLKKYPPFYRANKVACYLANDGEISLTPVIDALWQRKKTACVPVIASSFNRRKINFAPYYSNTEMQDNQYGIAEPAVGIADQIKPMSLDIVLMPLVAFDAKGNRIGMGGGYYDRSFSFLLRGAGRKKPRLIGVAYDFQEIDALLSESWDVPLDAVVTETRLIKIS